LRSTRPPGWTRGSSGGPHLAAPSLLDLVKKIGTVHGERLPPSRPASAPSRRPLAAPVMPTPPLPIDRPKTGGGGGVPPRLILNHRAIIIVSGKLRNNRSLDATLSQRAPLPDGHNSTAAHDARPRDRPLVSVAFMPSRRDRVAVAALRRPRGVALGCRAWLPDSGSPVPSVARRQSSSKRKLGLLPRRVAVAAARPSP